VLILAIGYRILAFPKIYDVGIAILFTIVLFIFFNIPNGVKKIILNRLFSRFSRFIASFSYSLYLIHYSLLELFLSMDLDLTILSFLILFFVINTLSFIFYLLFERNNVIFRKFLKNKLA